MPAQTPESVFLRTAKTRSATQRIARTLRETWRLVSRSVNFIAPFPWTLVSSKAISLPLAPRKSRVGAVSNFGCALDDDIRRSKARSDSLLRCASFAKSRRFPLPSSLWNPRCRWLCPALPYASARCILFWRARHDLTFFVARFDGNIIQHSHSSVKRRRVKASIENRIVICGAGGIECLDSQGHQRRRRHRCIASKILLSVVVFFPRKNVERCRKGWKLG